MRLRTIKNFFFKSLFFILSVCVLWQCNNNNPANANRPLIVSAGPDTTIRLNEEVYLAGSATKGGAPLVPAAPPGSVFSWKQVSGPDTVHIVSPSSQSTKIQFRQTGTYQISLTVSDGSVTKSDTVVYTILESIPPLIVFAGPDSTVRLNQDVYLEGNVTEVGLPDTVFLFSWKQVSGPDSVRILFPSDRFTKVQFKQIGVYTITLTGSDRVITKSDTVVYMVLDSISFKVLKPAEGDRIVIGDSVRITWQIVTPLPQTLIDVSIDKGKTWIVLTNPSLLLDTQWTWHVRPTLQACDSCLVKVRDYNNSSNFAKSGYFSLVNSSR